MAAYIGQSKTLMTNLGEHVASSLLANGTIVEVPEGASAEQIDAAWERKFGAEPVVEVASTAPATTLEKPRGNSSREDWEAYALSIGISEDDLEKENPGDSEETGNTEEPADPKDADPAGSDD
ncbi:hypothetical protein [Glutamicibacter nicotianae]|uniref:hypothetical protein n=1 Tax=Glutamicibacter nicotianae TaxID=37929 RepID=UPI00167F2A3A|nr:hypothetical protein [Glutamicibacter nicotianae]